MNGKQTIITEVEERFSKLPDSSYTKITETGATTELRTLACKPNMSGLQKAKRISRNSYVCLDTGEVKEYGCALERADNPHLKETLEKIRKYINTNFYDGGQFITLCYDGVMKDFRRAKKDLSCFLRTLSKRHKAIEYFWVLEPKTTGSWHFHLLTKGEEVTAEELQGLWIEGSSDVQDIYDVSGLACYLAPCYKKDDLTGNESKEENGGIFVLSKSKEKAKRLNFYPHNERIYGKSNGIKKWKEYQTTRGEARTYVKGKQKMSECSLAVVVEETGEKINQVNIETYKG
ncbi:MAG: hypothetical protein SPL89_07205 [Clostridia bacterium]|nr:hypothetical protein [Clostridia bacterium]